jgi:hypothetical protein
MQKRLAGPCFAAFSTNSNRITLGLQNPQSLPPTQPIFRCDSSSPADSQDAEFSRKTYENAHTRIDPLGFCFLALGLGHLVFCKPHMAACPLFEFFQIVFGKNLIR